MFLDFSEPLVSFMDVSCACDLDLGFGFFINFVFVNLCLIKLD